MEPEERVDVEEEEFDPLFLFEIFLKLRKKAE
jgi:hypothetical protein